MGVTSQFLDEALRIRSLIELGRSPNFFFLSNDDCSTLSWIFSMNFVWAWMEVDNANIEDDEVSWRLDGAKALFRSLKMKWFKRSCCQSIASSSFVLSKFSSSSKLWLGAQRNCRIHPLYTQVPYFSWFFKIKSEHTCHKFVTKKFSTVVAYLNYHSG